MALDANAWYSIQNFGNDYFLGCGSIGNCGTATLGLADQELFQLATINGSSSYYIRPKAVKNGPNGESFCVNIDTGVPQVASCSNQSATWGIGNWNGQDAGDGKFFFSTQRGDSQRLFLSNNETYSLLNYAGLSVSNQVLMQWGLSSRAAINDQSYSTVPAAITGGSATTTTTSANSTVTSTSSGSSTATSGPSSSAPGASTLTMIITPTVTATGTGGSRTSTSSVTPTVVSGADRPNVGIKTALALTLILPQILSLCF